MIEIDFNDTPTSVYYNRQFAKFDARNGEFVPTWNWAACFGGVFWYVYHKMYAKSVIYLIIIFAFAGIPAFLMWIYFGLFGNWDYYLLVRKNKQLW